MSRRAAVLFCALYAVFTTTNVAARAVNISNTWILPQEGFPVFYRYFRDRISWYEADAVCQFHHANLVTVDTTVQYDASRAYLKELDISNTLWIGLIKSNVDGDFSWTDYRALSGEGYWRAGPDGTRAPQCAAADPVADYRWAAHDCGGPDVASFVCELPVPAWASSCLVRALPALTAAFLPERGAIQLTTDCGLAGVRRVLCGPDQKHEDILKELSCGLPDDTPAETSSPNNLVTGAISSSGSIIASSWTWTTDPSTSKDTTADVTTPQTPATKLLETTSFPISSSTPVPVTETIIKLNISTTTVPQNVDKGETTAQVMTTTENIIKSVHKTVNNEDNDVQNISGEKLTMKTVFIPASLNVNDIDTDNLQSNSISLLNQDNDLDSDNDNMDYLMKTKHISPKSLHDQIAQLGTFDSIFTQPADNFVPPLVMAKSKLSNDMTVLTLEEKYAQREAEHKKEIATMKKQHAIKNKVTKYVKPETLIKTTPKVAKPNGTTTARNEDNKDLSTESSFDVIKGSSTRNPKLISTIPLIESKISVLKNKDIVKSTNTKKYNAETQILKKKLKKEKTIKANTAINTSNSDIIATTESDRQDTSTVKVTSKSVLSTETIPIIVITKDYESTTHAVHTEDIMTSTDNSVLNITSIPSTSDVINEHNDSVATDNVLSTTVNPLEESTKVNTDVKFDDEDKAPIIDIDMAETESRHSSSEMTTTDRSDLYSGNLDFQDLPRPNRSRKLSAPQRTKFYPYLRILG